MLFKVDYLSWTIPTDFPFDRAGEPCVSPALHILTEFLGQELAPIISGHSWEVHNAKRFYHTRIFDADTKISLQVGTTNKHVHCEFGGQALDVIRAAGFYEHLIEQVGTRASRIDFAVDFESECSVKDFIGNRDIGRFKAGGDIFSEDGETSYVGSWEGERFARVYRYHKPHPRSNMLRAEVVLRGKYAKQGITLLKEKGLTQATLAAHEAFQWKHELWKPEEATESRIKSNRADKEKAGTVRWLYGDIASCVIRLHKEGLIDAYDWFQIAVEGKIPPRPDIVSFSEEQLSSSDMHGEVFRSES